MQATKPRPRTRPQEVADLPLPIPRCTVGAMAPDVPAPSLAAVDDPVVRRLAHDGLYLGITAWTEPSLVESSELYPPTVTTAEQRLWLYASRYPITQVDSTFYHPPAERTAAQRRDAGPPSRRRARMMVEPASRSSARRVSRAPAT